MLDVGRHPNIKLLAYSEVEKVEGEEGAFKVTIRRKARYVDEDKCTGCGACKEKCPTVVPDAFNEGLGTRKAIYSLFAQGIPSTHTIDPAHCRQLNGKKCGICAKTCQAKAVNFDQKDRVVEIDVASIIIAAGYDVFDPSRISEYHYRDLPNVVTAIEFERLLSASGPTGGHLDRPSDRAFEAELAELGKKVEKAQKALEKYEEKYGASSSDFIMKYRSGDYGDDADKAKWAEKFEEFLPMHESLEAMKDKASGFSVAKRLAFVQCVGSRDFRFYPFCSGYCCMHSIKEAIIAHEHGPETTSTIFGMDIRAVGKGFEEYKIRGGNHSNITYVRGRVAEITEGQNHNPVITYEDTRERKVKSQEFDMVILATACAPTKGIIELSGKLGVELDKYNFIKTSPISPVDTSVPGVFVCGCAQAPMDVPESVAQASSAAARAAEIAFHYYSEKEKAVAC
ncbi:MAG: 4Fe-4S ferredoxin [Deltaproteobacteria bacterium CG_4_8_14_3_um_filter_51_11]|nr:MAG: 4Fe-4S ferredoxin [Desulfobacteraceae bacterium CG2_30_51_40]PIP46626.1 MAG: 4Fe-4S ferredoxin [Deltaproteobacteria bacterium CG23_combo_of_CG06-09_8_20_14_all_51_20]PIX20983.1 MAG: 4Fe-4S ferredoxin [Deltaproteobacteria bacterium CG_4_8_14_3_um_filter_51_11]PIY23713.1 MAG: 4Fe-4S ferredoxin [Deltaproteobacteria bacterium CG_4_10_14_3_um_filter_51_14]PJB33622.1 MAG: 4Fe-4S ferredoxin [Deltaproteobacteria bacterium CG_4_9_14_3_um_filter_51_14]